MSLEHTTDFFHQAPCGFHSVDDAGVFLEVNETELRWLGYSRQELVGIKRVQDLLTPESQETFTQRFSHFKSQGHLRNIRVDFLRKDGSILPVLLSSSAVAGPDGKFISSRCLLYDVTEWQAHQESVRRTESQLRQLLEAAPDAILQIDGNGAILLGNRAAEVLFGYTREELLGMNVETLVPDGVRPLHAAHRASYAQHPVIRPMGVGLDLKVRRKDGELTPVEISLSPNWIDGGLNVIAIVRDMTERAKAAEALRRSEEKLRQAEKLEALARLAGGTAHEFNNLLTMMLGYAELLQGAVTENPQAVDYLAKIRAAAKRAAVLTRQLLAFGRRQAFQPRRLDLNSILTEIGDSLPGVMGETIDTRIIPASAPVWVQADPVQLHQMIVNLAINARDAMPDGGKFVLALSTVDLSEEDVMQLPSLSPGRHAMLQVIDTGSGMTPEVQARLFEPFFSTRQFGAGAGLGLAMVYGIVSQSGGSISVNSQLGHGSTFTIHIPQISQIEAATGEASSRLRPAVQRGTETILLVEDQVHLLEMSREFLQSIGYRVLAAASGEEALTIARHFSAPIHLLLTDIVMPGRNGRQLASELLKTRPAMKVMYVSGYVDEAFIESGGLQDGFAFLEKPFELEELASKIRAVVEAVHASPS